MIDEDTTFEQFGYRSDELSFGSNKKVVMICDECGKVWNVRRNAVKDLCISCGRKGERNHRYGKPMSNEQKQKLAESNYGKVIPDEQRRKISNTLKGRTASEETKRKLSVARVGTKNSFYGKTHTAETIKKISDAKKGTTASEETKRLMSAVRQGISIEEWTCFVKDHPYCSMFNEACRERIRDKYDRECFICGLSESENTTRTGKIRKLSVHHIDMNKNQGCDDTDWKLIPTCMKHHGKVHNELWAARITWLLDNGVAA